MLCVPQTADGNTEQLLLSQQRRDAGVEFRLRHAADQESFLFAGLSRQ